MDVITTIVDFIAGKDQYEKYQKIQKAEQINNEKFNLVEVLVVNESFAKKQQTYPKLITTTLE